nr:suppressor of disruption of TFIIS-like [Tanacetum cinerariifolium]
SELPKTPIVCKPSQDAIEKALNIANINPQSTLFFEDSVRNIQSGKRVGLDTVLVGTSHRCKGADYALESIHNMKEAIPELWELIDMRGVLGRWWAKCLGRRWRFVLRLRWRRLRTLWIGRWYGEGNCLGRRAGSESRPPMLNKENYVPWSSRLLWYAKSRPNGKLIHNSILNGPYVRKMIPEPSDTNREITITETFHLQTDDELSDKELKQIEADDQAIQTIL